MVTGTAADRDQVGTVTEPVGGVLSTQTAASAALTPPGFSTETRRVCRPSGTAAVFQRQEYIPPDWDPTSVPSTKRVASPTGTLHEAVISTTPRTAAFWLGAVMRTWGGCDDRSPATAERMSGRSA